MIARPIARSSPRLAAAKIGAMARPELTPRLLPDLLFALPLSGYCSRTNGFCDGFDDKIDLCFGKLGKHRQGEELVRNLLRHWEGATLMTQAYISLLKMNGNRVMHAASNPLPFQLPHHFVAIPHANSIDVVDVASVLSFKRRDDFFYLFKCPVVSGRMRPA